MNNRQVALKLVLETLGIDPCIETTDDRKRIQKAVYMGQITGVDLGYRFSWYHMGPYSPELTKDYYAMAEEISAGADEWEGKSLKPPLVQRLTAIRPLLQEPLGFDKSKWLELVASYHYLREVSKKTHDEAKVIFATQKAHLVPYLPVAAEKFAELQALTSR